MTIAEVTAVSGRADYAVDAWMSEIEAPTTTLQSLANSQQFVSLGRKLLRAIRHIIHGEFKRQQGLLEDSCRAEGRPLTGRQALHRIYSHFQGCRSSESLNSIEDLMRLEIAGNGMQQLESFLNSFDSILAGRQQRQRMLFCMVCCFGLCASLALTFPWSSCFAIVLQQATPVALTLLCEGSRTRLSIASVSRTIAMRTWLQ